MRARSKRLIRCGIAGFMAGGSVATLLSILAWGGKRDGSETDWIMFYFENFFGSSAGFLFFGFGGVIGAGICMMIAIE